MIKSFLKKHGSGFWLHMLGAVAIMLAGWWAGYPLAALILNTALWPVRELWQKEWTVKRTLTFHVFLEWIPAVAVGAIIYWGL